MGMDFAWEEYVIAKRVILEKHVQKPYVIIANIIIKIQIAVYQTALLDYTIMILIEIVTNAMLIVYNALILLLIVQHVLMELLSCIQANVQQVALQVFTIIRIYVVNVIQAVCNVVDQHLMTAQAALRMFYQFVLHI